MANATRTVIDKITARVFCKLKGGGNPVTIFVSSTSSTVGRCHPADNDDAPAFFLNNNAIQKRLAQSCQWESVMVDRNLHQMSFFMPTGEQVSFCAHAAMGGAHQLLSSTTHHTSNNTDGSSAVTFTSSLQNDDSSYYKAVVHDHDIVSLAMTTQWQESPIAVPPTLYRILRDKIGLARSSLSPLAINALLPTFCNASIARPKTLVHVPSLQALHGEARAPSIENDSFRVACDAIESTGIYLYTQRVNEEDDDDGGNFQSSEDAMYSSWECRQFPRASGYPEDPATGIAAAALATSLDHRRRQHLAHNSNNNNLETTAANLSISPRYEF